MDLFRNIQIVPSTADRRGTASTMYHAPTKTDDCEGVMFVWNGTSHTAAMSSAMFHLQGSSYSSAGWTNIGSTVLINTSAISAGMKERVVVVDCHKPTRKWVRLAVAQTTGDFGVVAIKYGMRRKGSTDVISDSSGIAFAALSVSAT